MSKRAVILASLGTAFSIAVLTITILTPIHPHKPQAVVPESAFAGPRCARLLGADDAMVCRGADGTLKDAGRAGAFVPLPKPCEAGQILASTSTGDPRCVPYTAPPSIGGHGVTSADPKWSGAGCVVWPQADPATKGRLPNVVLSESSHATIRVRGTHPLHCTADQRSRGCHEQRDGSTLWTAP